MKRKKQTLCAEFGCRRASGRAADPEGSPFCRFHTPEAKAKLRHMHKAAAESREQAKGVKKQAKPRQPGDPGFVPLVCAYRRYWQGIRGNVVFDNQICGRKALRNPDAPDRPLHESRMGDPLCMYHKHRAEDQFAFPDPPAEAPAEHT